MQLDNAKRDYLVDVDEETTKMSISKDVESHIIKVLTEHSYDDPLGSSIREAVSNAVDSVTEAGTNTPVLVHIRMNEAGAKELVIEDKGLGLDDVSFKKYIMGLGESTKRNSSILLGGYGAGSKAWLAYTDNFSYICRKDGIERKYLIFKGEEYPECSLIYEKETTEVNGVTVIVTLRNGWSEESVCKTKIREQLSYLDNVYFNIPGFNNSYKIFRYKSFQYCEKTPYNQMHISLKNIYYPIDWNKIGLSPIEIPLAIRFDDYSDIKPIFNRESVMYNNKTVEAIKNKIKEVAEEFVSLLEENVVEYENFAKNYRLIKDKKSFYTLDEKDYNVDNLLALTDKKPDTYKVKDISLRSPKFYANLPVSMMLRRWNVMAHDHESKWKKTSIWHSFNNNCLDRKNTLPKVVVIDFTLSGFIKDYLREKHCGHYTHTYFVTDKGYLTLDQMYYHDKDELKLTDKNSATGLLPEDDMELYLYEFNKVTDHYLETFIDERGLDKSEEYLQWVEQRRLDIKSGKVKASGLYKPLEKEKGEVTISTIKYSSRADKYYVLDKSKCAIADLPKRKGLHVYGVDIDDDIVFLTRTFNKVTFIKANKPEAKHFAGLNQFMTMEQFKNSKPFNRLATYCYIKNLLEITKDVAKMKKLGFAELTNMRDTLYNYIKQSEFSIYDVHLIPIIIAQATEFNTWDNTIQPLAEQYSRKMELFKYTKVIKTNYEYSESEQELNSISTKMIYIVGSKLKLEGSLLEDYDLIKREDKELDQFNEIFDDTEVEDLELVNEDNI